jgi:RsiW-degrading membrane proteinase PrsW (M82 family)
VLLLAIFASLYAAWQIHILASPSRSIAWTHMMAAFAAGMSASFVLSLAAEYGALILRAGNDVYAARVALRSGAFTQDPFIEEALKLLPIAALLVIRLVRQRLNVTDIVVLSAASGAGFALSENALTLISILSIGEPIGRYADHYFWFAVDGMGTSNVAVPDPLFAISTWLPNPIMPIMGFGQLTHTLNSHVVWSVCSGLGLALLCHRLRIWPLAVILLAYSGLAHAAFNAALAPSSAESVWPTGVRQAFEAIDGFAGLIALAALIAAVAIDRRASNRNLAHQLNVSIVREGDPAHALRSVVISGIWQPKLLVALWIFVLQRRAYLNAVASGRSCAQQEKLGERLSSFIASLHGEYGPVPSEAANSTRWLHSATKVIGLVVLLPTLILGGLLGVSGLHHLWAEENSVTPGWIAHFLAEPTIFPIAIGLLGLGIFGQLLAFIIHIGALVRPPNDREAQFTLGHGLGLFATLGGAAFGILSIYTATTRDPLALMDVAHAIERWFGSHPLAVVGLALLIMAAAIFIPQFGLAISVGQAIVGKDLFGNRLSLLDRTMGLLRIPKLSKVKVEIESASGHLFAERVLPGVGGKLPNAGGLVRQFKQEGDQVYYRVFSGDSIVGSFLTAVPPKSSAFAREALALPPGNQAAFIQEVLVPDGTLLLRSRALPQPAWDRLRGGAEQFELLEHIPITNFGPGRSLP